MKKMIFTIIATLALTAGLAVAQDEQPVDVGFPVTCDFSPCMRYDPGSATIIPNWDGAGDHAVIVYMPAPNAPSVAVLGSIFVAVLDNGGNPVVDTVTGSECYYALRRDATLFPLPPYLKAPAGGLAGQEIWEVYVSPDCSTWNSYQWLGPFPTPGYYPGN